MKRKLNFVLLMALGAAVLSLTAAAQNTTQVNDRANARFEYATYYPSESVAQLRQVDRDNRRRCDGDHDRDDRHCYWRDRDGGRYRAQYYYRGNGYYGSAPVYGRGGWYDREGRWHSEKRHWHGDDR